MGWRIRPTRAPPPPMKDLWDHWPAVRRRLRRARKALFLLDFDGTLSHLVDHPSLARLSADTRRALARLAGLPRTHVAILSGRQLADVRRRVLELQEEGIEGLVIDLRIRARNAAADAAVDAADG